MDMHDPAQQAAPEQQSTDLNEVSATATDATTTTTAETPDGDAAMEVETIMTEGLEEDDAVEAEPARPHTIATLTEAAEALLAKDGSEIASDEIRRLRQLFTMLHKDAAPAAEAPAEGEPAPEPVVDEAEVKAELAFAELLNKIKAKKAEWLAQEEARRAANLERKNDIIAQILALAEDTDNVNRTFPRYRELQDEFIAVGDVDPTEETSVWKRYQEARERYSDNLKINKELRDYDFKKNLTEKEAILSEVATLNAEEDIIGAYRRLQDLHAKWREIGPVAKELRDEIWNRFREASAEINKRYQAFFEARKAREAENEAAKILLCQQVEGIDFTTLTTFASWDEATVKIQGIQEDWRKIGFASKKLNRQLFARFRAACDAFFAAKAAYFRSTREELAANLARKQALLARAEELKESSDWKKTADELVELQKQWKAVGAIPRKHSDDLWARFSAACDHFFNRRKQAGSGTRQAEAANLKAKRDIVARLVAFNEQEADFDRNTVLAELRKANEDWKAIGHVPFKEKDKVYEAFREAADALRQRVDLTEKKARRVRFEASVQDLQGDRLSHERERLVRALEARRNDLRTYENNLGFLSSKSKSGNAILQDLERRIERLKADIAELEEKITLLDSKAS